MALTTRNADAYHGLLHRLLPRSWAGLWPRRPDGSRLSLLLQGIADELGRADARIFAALEEVDPRTATETIEDWESELGLPDETATLPTTLEQRRRAAHAQDVATGGQSEAYLCDVADRALGIRGVCTIAVRPYGVPFRVGISRVGDPLNSAAAFFYWTLHAPAATAAGDRSRLEALINRIKPAHTIALYAYDL